MITLNLPAIIMGIIFFFLLGMVVGLETNKRFWEDISIELREKLEKEKGGEG